MPTDYTPLGVLLFLVALAVTAVLRGWLLPRSSVKRELEAKDAQIARVVAERDAQVLQISQDRDYWRSAWMTESESRRHADGQVSDLLELARLATERGSAVQTAPPRGELANGSGS